MTELDIGVIYLQNIQRNEHKYNMMSGPRVHSARVIRPLSHAAATRKKTVPFNIRQVSPQLVRRSSRSSHSSGPRECIDRHKATWKKQVHIAYPNSTDFLSYMGTFYGWLGAATIILLFTTKGLVRRFGWRMGAIATPTMVLVTGALFFCFVIFSDFLEGWVAFLGTTPVLPAVFFGSCQNILGKGTKYSLFDFTKEMAYIPLDQELKVKGKAAVDVVGGRLGKSGGSGVQQVLLIVTAGTQLTIAPYLAVSIILICLIWIWAVNGLSKEYGALLSQREAERKATKAAAGA